MSGQILIAIVAVLAVAAVIALARLRRSVVVEAWQTGLLYRDGVFVRALPPGRHSYFDPTGHARAIVLPGHAQAASVGPVDVTSKDGFAYRVTLGYVHRIADARRFQEESGGAMQTYGVIAPPPGFADGIASEVMTRAAALPLAEVQAAPGVLVDGLAAALGAAYPAITVESVTVTRVALPPEVRRLLSEVEAARLQGLAALERARGEGAALRSLANAARLVRDNPELGQLRLLQAIETARRAPTIVLGQPAMTAARATDE